MIASVYIHIPFCSYKCPYCDFNTYALKDIPEEEYLSALLKEIGYYLSSNQWKNSEFKSLYFGGGTPSLFSPSSIEKIISCFNLINPEITIEANPKEITAEQLSAYYQVGVNRLSLGAQSLNQKTLTSLGRKHSPNDVYKALEDANSAGFKNINLDLMFASPSQTLDDLSNDLDDYLKLDLKHISCYELTIEPGTPFYQSREKGLLKLPDEEKSLQMYRMIRERLTKENYQHYEISNFSKPGYESKHNRAYWMRESYLGIGAGSHGFDKQSGTHGYRWSNIANYQRYIEAINQKSHAVSWQEELGELDSLDEQIMLSLRTSQGCSWQEISSILSGLKLDHFTSNVAELAEKNLIVDNQESFYLTSRGQELANDVTKQLTQYEI